MDTEASTHIHADKIGRFDDCCIGVIDPSGPSVDMSDPDTSSANS